MKFRMEFHSNLELEVPDGHQHHTMSPAPFYVPFGTLKRHLMKELDWWRERHAVQHDHGV